MTYEKTTWVNGDIITAEKLNNLENGAYEAQNSVLIVSTHWDDTIGKK